MFYDRQGLPITTERFGELFTADYKRVDETDVEDASVSTVWIGIDHSFLEIGAPLIFKTMISGGEYDGEAWHYTTEEGAQAGHNRVVAALRAGEQP